MNDRIPDVPPKILPIPEGTDRPLWSIMIPAYNCINFLQETIQSVLVQDMGAAVMQIEVVDDCSTDGDVAALVEAVGKGRVNYFKQEYNRGSLRNFETCLNRSVGHWVHLLHGDDRIKPGFYKEIEILFTTFPKAGAVFTNFSYINKQSIEVHINTPLLKHPNYIKDFLIKIASRQLIQPPSIIVKRSVYENLGSFYAVHYGEDWEMWARISTCYPIVHSPKCLASYRVLNDCNISQQSYLNGQNIADIKTVINIIQTYLPYKKRKKLKKKAYKELSIYCAMLAYILYPTEKSAAYIQVKEAWKIHKSFKCFYYITKFFIKRLRLFASKCIK